MQKTARFRLYESLQHKKQTISNGNQACREGVKKLMKGHGDTFWSAKINLHPGAGESAQAAKWRN